MGYATDGSKYKGGFDRAHPPVLERAVALAANSGERAGAQYKYIYFALRTNLKLSSKSAEAVGTD